MLTGGYKQVNSYGHSTHFHISDPDLPKTVICKESYNHRTPCTIVTKLLEELQDIKTEFVPSCVSDERPEFFYN